MFGGHPPRRKIRDCPEFSEFPLLGFAFQVRVFFQHRSQDDSKLFQDIRSSAAVIPVFPFVNIDARGAPGRLP
jgi:hypothetical protein